MAIQLKDVSHLLTASRIGNSESVRLAGDGQKMAKNSWLGHIVSSVSRDANRATAEALLNASSSSGLLDTEGVNDVRKLLAASLDKGKPLTGRVIRQVMDSVYSRGVRLQNTFQELSTACTPRQKLLLESMKDKPLEFRCALLEKLPVVAAGIGQIASLPGIEKTSINQLQHALFQPMRNIIDAAQSLPQLAAGDALGMIVQLAVVGDPAVGEHAFALMSTPQADTAIHFMNNAERLWHGTAQEDFSANQVRTAVGMSLGVSRQVIDRQYFDLSLTDAVFGEAIGTGLQALLDQGGPQVEDGPEDVSHIPAAFMEELVPKGTFLLGSVAEKTQAEAETQNLTALSPKRRAVLGKELLTQENVLAQLEKYFSSSPELGVALTLVAVNPLGALQDALAIIPTMGENLSWEPVQVQAEMEDGAVRLHISTVVRGNTGGNSETVDVGCFNLSYTCILRDTPDASSPVTVEVRNTRVENFHTEPAIRL